MRKKTTGTVRYTLDPKRPPRLTAAQKRKLASIREQDIDYSDIPEIDERFFALVDVLTPKKKHALTLRLDEDIYQWLKDQGPGYQTRINAMLKALMLRQTQQL